MIFIAQEGCGVLQTTGRCRFSPGFRSLGPGRCPGSCPRESLTVAHGVAVVAIPRRRRECQHHDVPPRGCGYLVGSKGGQGWPWRPKGGGWWLMVEWCWNLRGCSSDVPMSGYCKSSPPKKNAHKPPFFWQPAGRYYFDTGASDLIIKREVQLKHGSVTGAMVPMVQCGASDGVGMCA